MRIALHDYAGHPFQIELARELARRGHAVHHLYFARDVTPRGPLAPRADDPPGLTIEGLDIPGAFDKLSYWRRIFYNRAYGEVAAARIDALAPDIVISANVPIDALDIVHRRCKAPGRELIVWLQDVFSTGVRKVLRKKLPLLGDLVGWRYDRLESSVMRKADHIVAITQDFVPLLEGWGVARARIEVIENWAPLGEITPMGQDNPWSREQGLAGKKVILYSGTLGLKHDPAGIAALARALADRPDTVVLVVSQGAGADWLAAAKAAAGGDLDRLRLMPFQPFERFSEVLATASVVLAVIEPEAGIFSVPSKVLSYLCAGRPILMAVPQENLAARTVLRAEAGLCLAPGDHDALVAAARRLLDDEILSLRYARNARAHAERHFAIGGIADRFEAIWSDGRSPARRRAA
jgi:glycosyltransferase involved in cell wall biosynthesis